MINKEPDGTFSAFSARRGQASSGVNSADGRAAVPAALAKQLALAMAVALGGCSGLVTLVEKPIEEAVQARPNRRLSDPVVLQGELLRFSDSFHSSILHAVNQLRHAGRQPDPRKLLSVELHFSQNVLAAATGANPLANLLDLIVIVALTRISVQDYWLPEVFGESARPLLDSCLREERQIWKIASQVLTAHDRVELQQAIGSWHQRNPDLKSLETLRVSGFVSEIAKYATRDQTSAESVFDFLHIDPLAALDPAAREIAQTRYFGERALFLMQRMPTLLRWQAELLAMSVADLPEVGRTLADADRLSQAATELSHVAQQLPGLIDSEREKIVSDVQTSSMRLTTLADKAQRALATGDRMARSADDTLKTFREIQTALGAAPRNPKATPVRIEDYTALAEQIAGTAAQINTTLQSLAALATGPDALAERQSVARLADDLERRGDRLIDRLFRAGILLIAGASLGLFVALLAYRLTAARLHRGG